MAALFIPIRVQDFISGTMAAADIYVCIDGIDYIKILHKGQTFEPERLKRYKDKDVEMLYLKAEDFGNYVNETAKLAGMLAQKPKIDQVSIVRFLNKASDAVISELIHGELNNESIEHVRAMNAQFLSSLQKKPNLLMVMASLEELGGDFSRHSIGVSMISTILAVKMNWLAAKTIDIIQVGGFVHDIGFRELPKELCMKPRAMMSPEEVKLYESHPFRGAQLLESVSAAPSEVVAIVFEHHEHTSGTGFPRGLKLDRVYPLARLVSLADLYCEKALSSRYNPKPPPGTEVVNHLKGIYERDFPSEYWAALDFLVGNEPSISKKKA